MSNISNIMAWSNVYLMECTEDDNDLCEAKFVACVVKCTEDDNHFCEVKFIEWWQYIKAEKEWRKVEEEVK